MNYAGDVTPSETFAALRTDPTAALVDVRMPQELAFVGMVDLATIGKSVAVVPWNPHMTQGQLVEQLAAAGLAPDQPLYFICRSGARSLNAAILATHGGFERAYNVSGGFEGPLDAAGHRGTVAGWKADELPWRQT
jgi:rhodanese-related sulfurtransferase